jgi:hypothetical protein
MFGRCDEVVIVLEKYDASYAVLKFRYRYPRVFSIPSGPCSSQNKLRHHVSFLVFINDRYLLGRRNETMLNAAISTQCILICSGVEETDIQRFTLA